MLVKNEGDRDKIIEQIFKIQSETLPYLIQENAHVYPASLVLSDVLPGITNAVNIWIRGDESVKFLGACHQLATRTIGDGKQHTALMWNQQDRLEHEFEAALNEIGRVLYDEGYFGPYGVDIMETEDGSQFLIDLNVQSATSLVLVYECLPLGLSRDALEEEFQKKFQEGRLVLLGNTRFGKKDIWAYPVVLAGEDQDVIKELGARLLKYEATAVGGGAQNAGGA